MRAGVAVTRKGRVGYPTTRGFNAAAQGRQNRALVLQQLLARGVLDRQTLARAVGLTLPSISRIVDELLRSEVLVEVAPPQAQWASLPGRPGPRAHLLDFHPQASVLSIFMGDNTAELGVHGLRGELVRRGTADFSRREGPRRVLARLRSAALNLLADAGREQERVVGLGVGVLAGVDNQGTIIVSHPWHDVPAAQLLGEGLAMHVVVDRVQRGLATAEAWLGAGAGAQILAVLYVGAAVGCGIAIDGHVLRGYDYLEGHLGHVVLSEDGPFCTVCNRTGCLGIGLDDGSFFSAAREALGATGEGTSQSEVAAVLYEEARKGDPVATSLVGARGRHIGITLALMTAVIDPNVIVIAGESLVTGWDLLQGPAMDEWGRRRPLPSVPRRGRVSLTSFGPDAELIGASALALHAFVTDPDRHWGRLRAGKSTDV